MKRNILSLSSSLLLVLILGSSCRHHRHHRVDTTVYVNDVNQPPVTNTIYINQQAYPPTVSISYPGNNFTSQGNYITVQGNVQNIQSYHQLSISQNGYPVRFFSYDPYNGNFHFQTFLQQGTNNLIVTANNPYGTGSQGVTVFFSTNTSYDNGGYNGGGNNTNNSVNPTNVTGGNYPNNSINTTITTNGGNYPNNSIHPNGTVNPNGGNYPNNSINTNGTITPNGGTNTSGESRPWIQYVNPSTSPMDVLTASYNISASVQNIANASQINISVNGTNMPSFNFNPSTHALTFSANLLTGFNSIHISATNSFGTDSKSTVLDYKPAGKPPRIEVFNPASSPFLSVQPSMIVSGYVYNVTSSSEISVTDNGSPITFNYNNTTHEIDVPVNLSGGNNQVNISATTSFGSDSKQVALQLVSKNCGTPNTNPNLQTGGVIQPVGNNTNVTPHTNTNPALNSNGTIYIDQTTANNTPHTNQNPNLNSNPNIYIDQTTPNNTPHTNQNQNPNLNSNPNIYIDQTNTNSTPHTSQNQNPGLYSNANIYIDQTNTNNTPHTNQNSGLNSNANIYIDQTNPNNNPHMAHNPNLQSNGTIYIDQTANNNTGVGNNTGMGGVHRQPEITRTSPGSSPYTTMSGVISVAANVGFVTNASGVSVTYDGSPVSFSYNPQTSEALNFTSPLRPGMNTFVIKATNSSGTVSQNVDVNYVPTNVSSNVNGNPNLHFSSGTNVGVNTPREFNANPIQQQRPQIQQQPVQQQKAPQQINTTRPVLKAR